MTASFVPAETFLPVAGVALIPCRSHVLDSLAQPGMQESCNKTKEDNPLYIALENLDVAVAGTNTEYGILPIRVDRRMRRGVVRAVSLLILW